MRSAWLVLIVAGAAGVARSDPPAPPKIDFDPLDCRWTFGNHEPIAMYRRAGNRVTGGIEGGARWLEDWHHWFDSEASTRLMEQLGLNILHCRFYKGMGWQFESRDFPNVKRFVENCHKHGVRALAYVLTLVEDAVFGGIPSDRTVMKPAPEMVSARVVEFRRPLLRRFDEAVRSGRAGLERPTYAPLRLLYSRESEAFSEQSHRAVLGAEEILLRSHVPYGLLPTDAATPLRIPADCDVLLVCDQRCLGDAQLDALVRFADGGGRLVITGQSGEHDESYRQRRANPLECLDGRSNVVRRAEVDVAPVKSGGWTIKVAGPVDGGRRLMDDLASVWSPAIRIEAPATVFAEVKRDQQGFSVHLVNYTRKPVPQGARIEIRADVLGALYCTFAAPMESRSAQPIAAKMDALGRWVVDLPPFAVYAVVDLLDPGHMPK